MSAILRKYGVQTDIYFPLVDRNLNDLSTGETHAAGDSKISKDGGAASNTSNSFSHIANGVYKLTLTATEMQAALIFVTVIDQGTKSYEDQVIIIETYGNASAQHEFDLDSDGVPVDSIAAGAITAAAIATGAIDADAIADNAIDAGAIADGAITAAKVATGAIDADALAADAVAEIADGVWDEVQSGHTTAGTFGKYLDTEVSGVGGGTPPTAAQIADAVWDEALADHVAAGSMGANQNRIDDIETDTAEIGAAGAGLTAIPWNAAWDAEVQSEVADALAVYDPPTQAEMTAEHATLSGEHTAMQADTDNIQTRLPAALVSGRMDSHVGSVADAVLTAAKFATGAFDAIFTRALSAVEAGMGFRTLGGAISKLVNKVVLSGGTLTVYQTDDATALGTQATTTDANQEPVVSVDTN